METQETPVFGPVIVPTAIEPSERPLAISLIIDISRSSYGSKRMIEFFKSALVSKFSNMEYDNVLLLNSEIYEDPGQAVAAISEHFYPVRRFAACMNEAVRSLMHVDRLYRRRIVLLTDQFDSVDVSVVNGAIHKNQTVLSDIEFCAVAFGPKYSRTILECFWGQMIQVGEPSEIESVIKEVCS